MSSIATTSPKPGRAQRKKEAARARIITKAESLFRSSSVDAVTIAHITEAADVGHGTFYLHFKSKHEVLIPIIQRIAEDLDKKLQALLADYNDPAEVVSISARRMGRAILDDPLWHWMLEHSGMPVEDMRDAIGKFAARDFGKGLMSGRFSIPEIKITSAVILGGYVNGLLTAFSSQEPYTAIDETAELQLRLLGLSSEEAKTIAHKPLPDVV